MESQNTASRATSAGQQETNAALAVLAAGGNTFALGQLWEINQGLLRSMFWKWYPANKAVADAHGMTAEDFEQEGYFAIQYAAQTYDPGKGFAFSTWLQQAMRRQINLSLSNGHRRTETNHEGKSRTVSADPLNHRVSTDAPVIRDDSSETTLGDLVPDPAAARDMQGVEDRLYHEQMHDAVEAALQKLPKEETAVLRCRFYEGKTIKETAEATGENASTVRAIVGKALSHLRLDQNLRRWHDDFISTRAWRNPGFSAWEHSGSIEERIVESLESRNLLNV